MIEKLRQEGALPWILLSVLSLIWGSSFILIKKGLVVFSAGEVGAIRILTASLFLLPLAIPKLKGLKARQWRLLFLTGLLGNFFPAFLFAIAETQLDSALTGVLNALTPLFVIIVGALFFTQKVSLKAGVGIVVGFAGTAFLVFSGSSGGISDVNYYAFYVVLATLCYGINLNLIKYYFTALLQRRSPVYLCSWWGRWRVYIFFLVQGLWQRWYRSQERGLHLDISLF